MEEKRQAILIVDDNEINRSMLAAMLQQDYRTVEVENGQQALDVIRQDKASVTAVLLDIIMPKMNGHEFCRRLKADPATRDISVIVLTASGAKDLEEKCLKLGVKEIMHKPYDSSYLLERIAFFLGE